MIDFLLGLPTESMDGTELIQSVLAPSHLVVPTTNHPVTVLGA